MGNLFRLTPPAPSEADLEARLRYRLLWKRGVLGEGVTVAVLDTGFTGEGGWMDRVEAMHDFTGEDHPVDPHHQHGTAVAACIHHVAPRARLANFKVLPQQGAPSREVVAEAVRHCMAAWPRFPVLNLSLYFEPEGCSDTTPCLLCRTVNEAVQQGITVVAAAGNLGPEPGTITCPGLARQALTVQSTWTRKEADWWNGLSRIQQWWWQDFTGEMGAFYGTSFSAGWASGGVALLKSAFPEATPEEIREAIFQSAYPVREAPEELAGGLQCEAALDLLLHPARYQQALRTLYINAGNEAAQRPGSWVAHALGLVLGFVRYCLLPGAVEAARKDLMQLQAWLSPDAFPEQQRQIRQLLDTLPASDS